MSFFRRIRDIARAQVNELLDKKEELDSQPERHTQYEDPYSHQPGQEQPDSFTTDEQKYYANLELSPGASFDEIKMAYRTLMKKYHPDMQGSDPERKAVAEEVTHGLNQAWEYFKTQEKSKKR